MQLTYLLSEAARICGMSPQTFAERADAAGLKPMRHFPQRRYRLLDVLDFAEIPKHKHDAYVERCLNTETPIALMPDLEVSAQVVASRVVDWLIQEDVPLDDLVEGKRLKTFGKRGGPPAPLLPSRVRVLVFLAKHPSDTQARIGKRLGISSQAVSRTVLHLIEKEYLLEDRVTLTDTGEAVVEELYRRVEELQARAG